MNGSPDNGSIGGRLGTALVFLAIGWLALYGFVKVAEPPERSHRPPFKPSYDETPLVRRLEGEGILERLAALDRAGRPEGAREIGRVSGSAGCSNAAALIRSAFQEVGLDVVTQDFTVTVPVTEVCEALDEHGNPLPEVTLYPFAPSGLIPTALPDAGIEGKLVFVETSEPRYLQGEDPSDCIALTYLGSGGGYPALAAVGVKAVIVMEDMQSRAVRTDKDIPDDWSAMTRVTDMVYPRFLARGPLQDHAGRRIRLRCRTVWRERSAQNIVGVLRCGAPKREALVLTAYYDSNSLVPDLAPGAEQAIPAAALLELAAALAPYRDTLGRDVIFAATAGHCQSLAGVCRLMEAIETLTVGTADRRPFEEQLAAEESRLGFVEKTRALLADEPLWRDKDAAIRARLDAEPREFREWFEDVLSATIGEINLEHKEEALQRRLDYLRAGSPVYRDGFDPASAADEQLRSAANRHPLLARFLAAQELDARSGNFMSLRPHQMAARDEFSEWRVRERLAARLGRLHAYHRRQIAEIRDSIRIRDLFAQYPLTLTLGIEINSGGTRLLPDGRRGNRDLALFAGLPGLGSVAEPQVSQLAEALRDYTPSAGRRAAFEIVHWGARDAEGTREQPNIHAHGSVVFDSAVWTLFGRLGFTVANHKFYPGRVCTPQDTFEDLNAEALREIMPVLGKTVLAMAHGRVPFKTIAPDRKKRILTLRGKVYGEAGVGSVVPSHPMADDTVARIYHPGNLWGSGEQACRAIRIFPVLTTNPYGEYSKRFNAGMVSHGGWSVGLNADAIRFGRDGRVLYCKDASRSAQSVFRNDGFPSAELASANRRSAKPIHISLFRCAPVELFETGNPMTLQGYRGLAYLSRIGLTEPRKFKYNSNVAFLEPDAVFYVAFQDGSSDNKELLDYRAFMLNADPNEPAAPDEPDIYGRGFMAADSPNLTWVHENTAASMLRTAGKRLALQKRHGMADELMLSFQARGLEWLETARKGRADRDTVGSLLAAGKSLAYAINNHPVIRKKISQAVAGIVWYLGLLVPFVFFFEKLVFSFTDIRKQLLACGIIFLAVFALLRLFHPAFEMVRSSLMILLGFVMLLLTLLVIFMVAGKFKQNIKDLRGKEGRIEGADINRGGVVGTAFMLGLNNMRRRKVRTGLTSVTLILLTFVMICFTSISTDLVDVEFPTGRSNWNGILFRKSNFVPLDYAELAGLNRIYGQQFPMTMRSWLIGSLTAGGPALKNAEILVDREFAVGETRTQKRVSVGASIALDWNEPMFSGLDRFLLTKRGWFPRTPQNRAELEEAIEAGFKDERLVILPDTAARELEITPEAVDGDEAVMVTIRGEAYRVQGIIDSQALACARDLDGRSMLPYDINSIQALGASSSGAPLISEDVKPLPASQVIIVNRHPPAKAGLDAVQNMSCGIMFPKEPYRLLKDGPLFPAVDYKEQRRLVYEHMERSGETAYYAIDGLAYSGSRKRARTFEGLLEMLIPILIAALTVFNTMRGSVYERRDEIYVYNAVGIAPNHVFFMFMAEACVYAVVGAMMGYLLSQATGRVLTALGLTGGLNMNYSSVETIYASLTIMAAVLLSTILPARDAARLASPADTRKWTVPEPDGDTMTFNLPFTFTAHDRIAVIEYFRRWLDANGEGSSGPFFCLAPRPFVRESPGEGASGGLAPGIETAIWLKPYDMGVSQRMEIVLPTDPETGEYIARVRLERVSGTSAGWARAVRPFLGVLRKQFLNWRAATPAERREMCEAARSMLSRCRPEPVKQG